MGKTIIIAIGLIFCAAGVFSQDIGKDFSATYNAYLSDNLSMDFNVTMYSDKSDLKGKSLGSGMIRKVKDNYYSKYGEYEYLISKNAALAVNNKRMEINYFPNKSSCEPAKISPGQMDSIISGADSIAYKGISGKNKIYSLFDNSSGIARTDMYIDNATGFVSCIEYFYSESTEEGDFGAYKIRIEYSEISIDKKINGGVFSLSKYLIVKDNTVTASSAFSKYALKVISKHSQ